MLGHRAGPLRIENVSKPTARPRPIPHSRGLQRDADKTPVPSRHRYNRTKRCQLSRPSVLSQSVLEFNTAPVHGAGLHSDEIREFDSQPGVFFDRVFRREERLGALVGTKCPGRRSCLRRSFRG